MSEIGIKDQCFGVEVEMTGITRRQAAEALAAYFGTSVHYCGTYYHVSRLRTGTVAKCSVSDPR